MKLIFVVMNDHEEIKITSDFRKEIASSSCIYVSGPTPTRFFYAHSLQATLEGAFRDGIRNANPNNDNKNAYIYCIAMDDKYYEELHSQWELSTPESRGFYEILLNPENISPVGYLQYDSGKYLVQPFKCLNDERLNQSAVFYFNDKECDDTCLNKFLQEVNFLNGVMNLIPVEVKDPVEIPSLKNFKSLKEICIDYVNNNFTLFLTAQGQSKLKSLPHDLTEKLSQDVLQSHQKTNQFS